ncbi:hypothetical protein JW851_02585 [Candidatus Woesearchaeota archaeon]|nr:hypothetical protein [Candidatus Woesearchaeota archaeon]
MPKHTIKLEKEEISIIKTIRGIHDIKSIDKAISFIINDYDRIKGISKFIKEQRKK